MSAGRIADLEPVLMLVPYFAPQTHAAMFRAHKLAKYLPEHGFRPVIVTTDVNYLYNDDPQLLEELPEAVEIHRARFIEPTARGLRMALGGKDRTFAAMKRAGIEAPAPPPKPDGSIGEPMSLRNSAWQAELIRLFGEWPDRHWTWSISAYRLCRRLIREQNIRLLYTSANPISPLRSALRLQHEFDLKWVADFRDPVGYGRKHSTSRWAAAMEHNILSHTMASADLIAGAAESIGLIFFDLFDLREERYRFIPTGLDQAYLDPTMPQADSGKIVLHVGEVMPDQSPHVFAALAQAKSERPDALHDLKLLFVGRRELNEPRVSALTMGIADWSIPIEFVDHAPQRKVYELIQQAHACLLAPGEMRYWWTNFAKMVDYIALGAPVIAHVPAISAARTELTRAGLGFFLDAGEEPRQAARRLADWLSANDRQPPTDYAQRYTARRQTADFAALFDQLAHS